MTDELLRATIALPVAVLCPLGIPAVAAHPWARALLALAIAALGLAPVLPEVEAWLLLALAAGLAWRLRPPGFAAPAAVATPPVPLFFALGAAVVAAAAAALVLDPSKTWDVLRDGARSDAVVFVVLGALAALPVAGVVVSWTLAPFAARLAAEPELEPPGMLRAGLYIGWCERALVVAFLLGGEPGAAALALTAKSVARFPAFNAGSEALAEYVLIGTLWSFMLAVLVAMGIRALLGLPVL